VFVALSFQLNVLSALAGISLTFATLPLQIYIARLFSSMRRDTAIQTDKRVRHMSEVIDGISSVKGYGWEQPFISMILTIRNHELFNVLRAQRLRAINYCLYFCSPHITLFAIFIVYFHLGGKLTLPLVFSTMSFVQILRLDIGRFFTRAIETSSEAYASAHRIEHYLNTFENSSSHGSHLLSLCPPQGDMTPLSSTVRVEDTDSKLLLEVKNGTFAHSQTSAPVLQKINFTLHRGELLIVIGSGERSPDSPTPRPLLSHPHPSTLSLSLSLIVGAGKSSLLTSLLGETVSEHLGSIRWGGAHQRRPRIAYCTQRPWIVATSVKANITMAGSIGSTATDTKSEGNPLLKGHSVDACEPPLSSDSDFKNPQQINEQLYRIALETCRLNTDLSQWPDEDLTEIGERGVSVSGGQKARIALARAVYSDPDGQPPLLPLSLSLSLSVSLSLSLSVSLSLSLSLSFSLPHSLDPLVS
jgi:ABC-type multidrug transport system fused ATPase/permease subunit